MVKADIDRAILANTTEKGFWKTLREMGYELYLYKKNGELRDRPSIRAPFADKNIRLSTLGDGYSPEQITQRILQNVQKQYPFPDATAEARKRLRYRPEKYPKAKGIYALYLRYCYELHIIVKHPTSVKLVSFLFTGGCYPVGQANSRSAASRQNGNHHGGGTERLPR